MSLPLLPYNKINTVYEELLSEYPLNNKLSDICTYFEKVWLNGKDHTPESWSWFNEPIRTNNDVKGSHRRLNTRAQHRTLTFYRLMELLGEESSYVDYQHAMVASDALSRNVSKHQSDKQCKLFELWFQYFNKDLTPMELLCEIFDSTEPNKEWNSQEVVAFKDDKQQRCQPLRFRRSFFAFRGSLCYYGRSLPNYAFHCFFPNEKCNYLCRYINGQIIGD